MNRRILDQMVSLGRKLLPATACAIFTFPAMVGLVCAGQDTAQPQRLEATMKLPVFEFSSVAPTNVTPKGLKPAIFAGPGGEVRAQSMTLGALLRCAFDVQPFQIVGGPEWIHRDLFDIVARPPATAQAGDLSTLSPNNPLTDQQRLMLQSLLISRFQLAFHREYRTGQIYVLEKERGRVKMHAPKDSGTPPWVGSNVGTGINGDGLVAKNVSMPVLAVRLSRYLQGPVEDRTGLKDSYDFKAEYWNNNPTSDELLVNSITKSLAEVGLKLESSTGPVSTIVVDDAERPAK
jgi:uncharacterized protein (TIGR03435 family)